MSLGNYKNILTLLVQTLGKYIFIPNDEIQCVCVCVYTRMRARTHTQYGQSPKFSYTFLQILKIIDFKTLKN